MTAEERREARLDAQARVEFFKRNGVLKPARVFDPRPPGPRPTLTEDARYVSIWDGRSSLLTTIRGHGR